MEFFFIFILTFAAFYFILLAMAKKEDEQVSLAERIGKEEQLPEKKSLLSVFSPLNLLLLKKIGLTNHYNNRLYFVRDKVLWGPGEFFALKELLMVILALVLAIFNPFDILRKPWIFCGIIFGSFFLPDFFWLGPMVSKRKDGIRRWLPETVDLLYLCVSAGLDFLSSLKWILRKSRRNPMLDELKIVMDEINIGKSRVQALKDMSRRLNIPDVSSFVQGIIQAERMGTPVAEAFTIISEDSRYRRLQRGERMALKAPIKILLPLIFFILPAVMIIVGGPILIRFLQGGFNMNM